MILRNAGVIVIHPITRTARLHQIHPSKSSALRSAIWLAKQELEVSSLRGIIVPRLYVGDDDELEYEILRLRAQIVARADKNATDEYLPHIYSVIMSPYINELEVRTEHNDAKPLA